MQPLSSLYLFPVYQTREEYLAKTGKAAPMFRTDKPVKSWEDPSAATSLKRKIVYDNVLAFTDQGLPLGDAQNKPFFEPMLIDREDAVVVNIPPKDFSGRQQEIPSAGNEVPVPCRALRMGEELEFSGFGGLVMVTSEVDRSTPTSFTLEDRALLKKIAAKLGV